MLSPSPDIELRPLADRDAPELFRLIDLNRAHLRQWLPWLDSQRAPANSLDFIRIIRRQNDQRDGLTVGIWYQGSLGGVVSILRVDPPNKAAMIGYWLSAHLQGRGIMTESVRAMVTYAFASLGLHRIEIRCATGNTRSRAIPERLGFHREGVLRDAEWLYDHFVDLVVYSMLAPDWKEPHHAAS